jgi:hypothetical protein
MNKLLIAAALALISLGTRAEAAPLSRADLIARLRIRADVLVMSDDGKRILELGEESHLFSGFTPEGKFQRDWTSESDRYGSFKIRHTWTIDSSGAVHVKLEEFSEMEVDSSTGQEKSLKNPIGTEEHDLVDFGTVTYAVKANPGKKVMLRFVPEIGEDSRPETIGKFRINGNGVSIYDSEGVLWASDLDMNAAYLSVSTHRGTLILSYSPFKGSEPVGVANGKKITIRMKEYPRVTLQSETDFVPLGTNAQVFVKYLKGTRTAALNSVREHESSDEQRLLERMKQ